MFRGTYYHEDFTRNVQYDVEPDNRGFVMARNALPGAIHSFTVAINWVSDLRTRMGRAR